MAFFGDTESVRFAGQFSGQYRAVNESNWVAGIGLNLAQTFAAESDLNDFDLTAIDPHVFTTPSFSFLGKPANASLDYAFRRDYFAGDGFETSHRLNTNLGIRYNPSLYLGLYYHVVFDDFDVNGAVPATTSRDATQHRIGLYGTYTLRPNRRFLTLGGSYRKNDADGRNFEFDSYGVSARFRTKVKGPVWLSITGAYSSDDYTRFTVTPARDQGIAFVRGVLMWHVTQKLTVDLSYSYTDANSDRSEFEVERNTVAIGATYAF